ncbi:MAG: NAD(P)/FAD-dependent oxidoreductase [Bacteroidetes bacterium]|nr:NAD(P)/FAD-dependent oxidoreductase [Bacteroidota bacterium]MDF2450980.1 NAD(P)/FAD-dependent oxidoreductase [Bacteroidota bacterium]
MKNLYTSELTKSTYDSIIIGSGVGGLTTAVCLAKAGKKVLVLEKHYAVGGFTHTFKRKKFEWDVGAHYIGQVNNEGSLIRKAFDYVTNGKLQWDDVGEIYDQAIIEGEVYNFRKGLQNQIDQIIEYFPDDEKSIRLYYDLVLKVSGHASLFFSEKTMPRWLSKLLGRYLKKSFLKYSRQTTYEVLSALTKNEKLISVLCAQCGNYGLTPKQSSFGIHALVVTHYIEGAAYPVGGAANIHKSMESVIMENGGLIAIKADVKNVIIENNKAIGVLMQNGDKLFAKKIISDAGAHNTFNKLILPELQKAENTIALNKVKPSVSHVCIYVGLNATDEELKLPKYNIWLYENYKLDESREQHLKTKDSISPVFYISFPSAKDSEWQQKHPGTASIQVLGSYPFNWMKEWEHMKWQKRGDDYESVKEELKEVFLKKLYETLPQIKGHVEICELSTPLSTKHFSNYDKGEIYGLEHTPQRFELNQLRPQTNYKNLYLTGQDIIAVGVCSAMFSGVVTSISILNRNLLWRISRYKNI